MPWGMSSSPRRCAVRLLLTTGVCAGLLLPAAGASAEEPDGATVVGELVQAYPEQAYPEQADPSAEHGSDAPLSWIRTEAGDTVRVATDDLPDVPAGSTVAVTVGDRVPDEAGSDGYEPAHEVLGTDVLETSQAVAAPPAESLTNQVTVALVAPAGGERDGVTLRQVVDAVNGPVAR